MINHDAIHFETLEEKNFDLLTHWFKQPHVIEWWPAESRLNPSAIREKYSQKMHSNKQEGFIIYSHSEAIGYIQCYDATTEAASWLQDQPKGTWGIDLFIGEPSFIGKEQGVAIVTKFVTKLFARQGVSKIIVDPDSKNTRAIRCFQKAGFIKCGQQATPNGLVEFMATFPSYQLKN